VSPPKVAVIMPTLGTSERAPLLRRALEGVISQARVEPVPIVVFNGPHVDLSLVDEVAAKPRVRALVLQDADLPSALQAGRALVDEPWYAELDDDDELLEGALAQRIEALSRHPDRGAVVTNGLRRGRGRDRLHLDDVAAVASDPLHSLVARNWLLPDPGCAGPTPCRRRSSTGSRASSSARTSR
jgi:glycosyltransferase involved in cell wall biosynthesis